MSVNKALDSILENRLDSMRNYFSEALATKAVEKLEERKIEIAKNYFGQMMESDLPISTKKEKIWVHTHKKSGKEKHMATSKPMSDDWSVKPLKD